MSWFPVRLEVLGSLEFQRLPPDLLGVWVRLCGLAAQRDSGGLIPGVALWTRDEFPRLLGTGVTRGTIGRLEAAGLATWAGADLLVLHYPADAEESLRRQRAAGAEAAANRVTNGRETTDMPTRTDREPDQVPGVGSAESLESAGTPGAPPGRGSKSKRGSKSRSTPSGEPLRGPPDPAGGQVELFGEPPAPKARRPQRWELMLQAFGRGAGERWTGTTVDRGLAIRLAGLAADLKADGITAADLIRAGEYAARGRREQLTPSWVATTGRLVEAIGRSRHAEASPRADDAGWTVIRGGRAVGSTEGDDPPLAAAADPPA